MGFLDHVVAEWKLSPQHSPRSDPRSVSSSAVGFLLLTGVSAIFFHLRDTFEAAKLRLLTGLSTRWLGPSESLLGCDALVPSSKRLAWQQTSMQAFWQVH